MRKLVMGVVIGLLLGSVGTAFARSSSSKWTHSGPGYSCSNIVFAGIDTGVVCTSTKRDWAGGRLSVNVTQGYVVLAYKQSTRGGPIYFCKTGHVPVGYHGWSNGNLPYWDRCG